MVFQNVNLGDTKKEDGKTIPLYFRGRHEL